MNGDQTKQQLLEELIRMQKDIDEKIEAQKCFISCFQLLIQNDGLFSQVIDNLPYPIAIFKHSGVVHMANKALMREAGLVSSDISSGKINLLNRITDENYSLLEAVENVFLGETTMLKNLVFSLALFCRDDDYPVPDTYQNAVLFPVTDARGCICYGAVMLMK